MENIQVEGRARGKQKCHFKRISIHRPFLLTAKCSSPTWQYKNPRLKVPRGLEIDCVGNIFVAARGSDNIHVLSVAGSLIRIIEDVPKPVFIKLMEERRMCCVCSNYKVLKVYAM